MHHKIWQRSWLRHYATSRKVAGSSPDEVDFFLIYLILPNRTMTLGSTQPLTEMSTTNLPVGGDWQPYRHLWDDCLENVGASTSHNPIGLHGLLER
jgi:hypothetical protein